MMLLSLHHEIVYKHWVEVLFAGILRDLGFRCAIFFFFLKIDIHTKYMRMYLYIFTIIVCILIVK